MPRVGIAGLLHESNTFLEGRTVWADFAAASMETGEAMRRRWQGTHHELGGLFEGLADEGMEAVPGFAAYAVPGPAIAAADFERLAQELVGSVAAMGPIDGLLVALHGATVSEEFPDADGELLARLRAHLGPGVPVVATLDLHANVSEQMAGHATALVSYRSNPHLDQRDRGREAAGLLARALRGETRPLLAVERPPLVIPIGAQNTAEAPARGLYEDLEAVLGWPGILSASVNLGFYYADVAEMGASFAAVSDGDAALARRAARWMAERAWARRAEFDVALPGPEQAVSMAMAAPSKPVALMDVGDNVGGGAPGTSQVLLSECLRRGAANLLVVLHSPEGAARCAGESTGGRMATPWGWAAVRAVSDGRFSEPDARHGGWSEYDQGLTGVAETEQGTTLVFTSRRMAPFSLRQITSLGIKPEEKDILIVKGVIAPQAAYRPVCGAILLVDTPGPTAHDPRAFSYSHARRRLFPLDPGAVY